MIRQEDIDELRKMSAGLSLPEWRNSEFYTHEGKKIETVEDVVRTVALTALNSTGAFLYGGSVPFSDDENDGSIVMFYTGNGPFSAQSAALIASVMANLHILLATAEEALALDDRNRELETALNGGMEAMQVVVDSTFKLTAELNVLINGKSAKDGASLEDIVGQVRDLMHCVKSTV